MGSLAYALIGVAGAFAVFADCYLAACLLGPGIRHSQRVHPLVLSRVPRDLAEGFAFVRRDPVSADGAGGDGHHEPVRLPTRPWWRR